VGSIIEYTFQPINSKITIFFSSDWTLSEELVHQKRQCFTLKPYTRFPWKCAVGCGRPAFPRRNQTSGNRGPDHVVRMTAQNIPAFVTEELYAAS